MISICLLMISSCTKEQAIPVEVDYDVIVLNEDYSTPVQVKISNKTTGADAYEWTFDGSTSNTMNTSRNPGTIVYEKGGDYLIKLEATNQDGEMGEKSVPITIFDGIDLSFDTEIIKDSFSPVEVKLTNNTIGATSYKWTFDGGTPEESSERHPENIIFTEPGKHIILLEASTGFESNSQQQTITVAPYLEADFDWDVAFEDDDYQAPVTLTMVNNSISATGYQWIFEGGLPQTSTEEAPTVTFDTSGIHSITLKATNGKETKEITKTVEVSLNTNIRAFKDVKLGINTAHNGDNIGAFFSTKNRKVYSQGEVSSEIGEDIEIVFFGLDEAFSFNKFISPDKVVGETSFAPIPNAQATKFINSQENCGCGTSLSVAEFDAMEDDGLLKNLIIEETNGGSQHFTAELQPRIILFQTADGRKGAIKVKEFKNEGSNSYILIDIKTQKEPN
ncbi:PKD domain-containing protein [Joostella sp.]|uniref:PKD domain-containing protein n=1 Tax=Joostella sp. TaxID=2231138 RepID=UPI003A939F8E